MFMEEMLKYCIASCPGVVKVRVLCVLWAGMPSGYKYGL